MTLAALAALLGVGAFAFGWTSARASSAARVAAMALGGALAAVAVWRVSGTAFSETSLRRWKAVIPLLALWLAARGQRVGETRARGVALALGVFSLAVWAEFGHLTPNHQVHRRDVFHYFIGARHHRELGYDRLYECTAVAEAELRGEAAVRARRYRELRTGLERPGGDALAQADACHARFAPARWRSFRDDVRWFRDASDDTYWQGIQLDHGYNPTPVWTLLEGSLTRLPARATRASLAALALLDPLLLLAALAFVGRAFGIRVAALGMIFWGAQEPASAAWMSGCVLRNDWLALTLAALCLQRRGRHALAGAALGWAAATRGFPAALLLGGAASQAHALLRGAPMDRRWTRLAAGFAGSVAALVALSALYGGADDWAAWLRHIRHHNTEFSSNRVGLRTLFEYTLDGRLEALQRAPGDVLQRWDLARAARSAATAPWYRATAVALVGLIAWALRRVRTPWLATSLSAGAVWCLANLSSYYWALAMVLVIPAAAAPRWERAVLAALGLTQLALVMPVFSYFYDDRYAVLSAAVGALTLAAPGCVAGLRGDVARRREAA